MELRVIFREVQGKLEVIQVVVIGKRDKETVYKIAENRMNSLNQSPNTIIKSVRALVLQCMTSCIKIFFV